MPMTNNTIAHIAHLSHCHNGNDLQGASGKYASFADKTLSPIINLLQRLKNLCSLSLRCQLLRCCIPDRSIEIDVIAWNNGNPFLPRNTVKNAIIRRTHLCHVQTINEMINYERSRKLKNWWAKLSFFFSLLRLTQLSVIERACVRALPRW